MDRKEILNQHKLSIPAILIVMGVLTGILVLSHLFFTAYDNPWVTLQARNFRSIPAIFTTNFLHQDIGHLWNNLVGFWVLGFLALFSVGTNALKGMFWGAIGCGLASWLFLPSGTVMIGFSGVVFSLIGILFVSSIRSGRLHYIVAVCLIIWFLDAGFFDTIRPTELSLENRIAWQGHLGGFIGGIWHQVTSTTIALMMLLQKKVITADEYEMILERGVAAEDNKLKKESESQGQRN